MVREQFWPLLHVAAAALCASSVTSAFGAVQGRQPEVRTRLGVALGTHSASGVERYGSIPYAVPPLGSKRFARAEVSEAPWPSAGLDAALPSPPCIQAPAGDPRSPRSESGPPTEDCLTLDIYRPTAKRLSRSSGGPGLLPVMVYVFGGGLCTGYAGNEYSNSSLLALKHNVVVVNVNYRLGPLGFLVGSDESRPGSGGMNGIHDIIVALQWLRAHVADFGGSPSDVTLFGQSSGGYSICTLCVAPEASGLFHRAVLQSGPCLGGPPGRGWGPMAKQKGLSIAEEVLRAHNASNLSALRALPAEEVQWPDEWMNDLDLAPYFSGYFEDDAVVPGTPEMLWKAGRVNPMEVLVNFNRKDGTAAFYGTSPTLGLVPPNPNTSTPNGYSRALQKVWGDMAARVEDQYPGHAYATYPSAFMQADADAYVICPLRRIVRYSAASGRRVWVSEFAHFQPSPSPPDGCEGQCEGYGCDNGVELDVVPGHHTEATKLWATHGTDVKFVFGTQQGPDGIGPPNNVTHCTFSADEQMLSEAMMASWASFARYGDPSTGSELTWPAASIAATGNLTIWRQQWSVKATDGESSGLRPGMNDINCDFWDQLYTEADAPSAAAPVVYTV